MTRGAEQLDALIIGGGAAGLAAAIECLLTQAGDQPPRVAIVEQSSELGGAAAIAGGGVCLADTTLQRELGIDDSIDLAFRDWSTAGGAAVDSDWARRYLENATKEVYDWLDGLGVRWQWVEWREGNSVARWHRPVDGGAAIATALIAEATRLGAKLRTETTARELLVEDGAVTGIEVDSPNGPQVLAARTVLVATGGFVNNLTMLREQCGVGIESPILCGGAPHANGSGHHLLAEVKAQFVGMDRVWFYPFGAPNYRRASTGRGLAVRGLTNDLWLDRDGRRFHNETLTGGGTGGRALLDQPGQTCWTLFDSTAATRILLRDDDYYGVGDRIRHDRVAEFLEHSPHVWRGPTVEVVATAAGLPSNEVVRTVHAFNQAISSQLSEDRFGRPLAGLRQLAEGPFYLMQYFPLAQKNLGGVRTDLSCRVLDNEGAVIPGLLAAGEVAGMAGGHINGVGAIEGTMLGPSLYSGRVAGREMREVALSDGSR